MKIFAITNVCVPADFGVLASGAVCPLDGDTFAPTAALAGHRRTRAAGMAAATLRTWSPPIT